MSFRFGLPNLQALDGRAHREEELTSARMASQQRPLAADVHAPEAAVVPQTESPVPMSSPPQRRLVVFADPVAFRYALADLSCSPSS